MQYKNLQQILKLYASRLQELKNNMTTTVVQSLAGKVDERDSFQSLQEIENEVDGIQECISLLEFLNGRE